MTMSFNMADMKRSFHTRIHSQRNQTTPESLESLNGDLFVFGFRLFVVGEHRALLLVNLFRARMPVGVIHVADVVVEPYHYGTWLVTKTRYGTVQRVLPDFDACLAETIPR